MTDILGDAISGFLSDPTVTAVGAAIGVAFVALWIAAAWWAYTDSARRTESTLAALVVAGWIVVSTPLMVPFALAIYVLARPQQTASEGRTRHLAGELVDQMSESSAGGCPSCGVPLDPAWLRCPSCTTWLAVPCAGCGSWSDPSMAICPFCGSEEREEPVVEPLEPALAGGRARRVRRTMRGIGPGSGRGLRSGGRRSLISPEARPQAPLRSR